MLAMPETRVGPSQHRRHHLEVPGRAAKRAVDAQAGHPVAVVAGEQAVVWWPSTVVWKCSAAERRMTKIMRQRQSLGEILVEAERTGECPCDLRDFQGVGEPGSEMIALVRDKHLGLMLEAAEGGGVDDAVAIAAEGGAPFARGLRIKPPAA